VIRWRTVRTVLGKELRETIRDRRTLFMMLVLPTLLYPAMLVLIQQIAIFGQRQLSAAPARVAMAGAEPALVRFMDSSRGRGRVWFASDHPVIPAKKAIDAAKALPLSEEGMALFLGDAAHQVLTARQS